MMQVSAALLLLWLPDCVSQQVTGPWSVWAPLGGSLTVRCQYKPKWESNVKWWCRGEDWGSCLIMVKSSGLETISGRVSIQDSRGNHTIMVTMVNLEAKDTDTYWCGIEKTFHDLGHRVQVTVSSDLPSLRGPKEVSAAAGESLAVQCRYNWSLWAAEKSWCRGAHPGACGPMASTRGAKSHRTGGRVSIWDDWGKCTFTVTMEKLSVGDSDTYWCVVGMQGAELGVPVIVSISPATTQMTITTKGTPKLTSSAQEPSDTDGGSSGWEIFKDLRILLPLILAILLILLVGISLVAWKMVMRQKKGDEGSPATLNLEEFPGPQDSVCYENLTVHRQTADPTPLNPHGAAETSTQSSQIQSSYDQVEYAIMDSIQTKGISYTTMTQLTSGLNPTYDNVEPFSSTHLRQDWQVETEYSVIQQPLPAPSIQHL
ncbi:CMRF35-like molecule 1 [Tachyglossus aculeatus]|uniref:CMRF35-like molecule 1 n=1 Tax=Tachyglossus aculeatus TaxID=9261 RepID=UPI0018F3A47B|nr:CMRF35-like molecule 1 [Tachyglossus aculeatus]